MKKRICLITMTCALLFSFTTSISASPTVPTKLCNYITTDGNEDLLENPIIEKVEQPEKKAEKIEITDTQKKLITINNKFEIVKTVIGDEYENLELLIEQIDTLNTYIIETNDKISADKETEEQILTSLDSVEDSLNKLLKTFNIELTEDNKFYEINGLIKEINDDKIIIEEEDKLYEITLTEKTLIKTEYEVGDVVNIKYSGSTTIKDKIVIDKCLSLIVAENLL